jgi:hypothetical protein
MLKSSLLIMAVLTIVLAIGLKAREVRQDAGARVTLRQRPGRWIRRWTNAAALAAILTMVVMGGLHWIRVAQG